MKQKIQQALKELERLDAVGASGPDRHRVLMDNFPHDADALVIFQKAKDLFGSDAYERLLSAWLRESTIR